MKDCTDFIGYVNSMKHAPIYNNKRLSDFLIDFCLNTTDCPSGCMLIKESKNNNFVVIAEHDFKRDINSYNFSLFEKSFSEQSFLVMSDDTVVIELLNEIELRLIVMLVFNTTQQLKEIDYSSIEMMRSMAWLANNQLRQMNAVKKYKKSDRIFNLTFEQVGSGRCITDLEGKILEANNKFFEIIGYSQDEVLGISIKALTVPEDWMIDLTYKEQLFKGQIPYFSMEKRYIKKDGSIVWVYTTVTLMSGEDGEEDFLIGIVQDITSLKDADIEPLTGLYNRRHMMVRLQDELDRTARSKKGFSLLLTDIDYFKNINDVYGHDCGDEVLQSLAKILKENVRSSDSVCRWGGEEFLILLPETDIDSARILAERIRESVEKERFCYEDKDYMLTMTFGLSAYNEKQSIKEMIKSADSALYEGKRLGRNIVV